jgi:hypothetical protein
VNPILVLTHRSGRAWPCRCCAAGLADGEGYKVKLLYRAGSVIWQPFCERCIRSARSLLRLVRSTDRGQERHNVLPLSAAAGFHRADEQCTVCGCWCSWSWVRWRRGRFVGGKLAYCPDCYGAVVQVRRVPVREWHWQAERMVTL